MSDLMPEQLQPTNDFERWAQKVLMWFAGQATREDVEKLQQFIQEMPSNDRP